MIKSVVHASRVLEAFQSAGDVLRLKDVVSRTGFNKACASGCCTRCINAVFWTRWPRITTGGFRKFVRACVPDRYAAQGQDASFDREVQASLSRAAERDHVELIIVDNRYQPKMALRGADYLIREQVDLVIEFQTDEGIAPAIASKYLEANIPFIAIDIPHPGATYFGANIIARTTGGELPGALGEAALGGGSGGSSVSGAATRRIPGEGANAWNLAGITETIRLGERCRTVSVDGDGQFRPAWSACANICVNPDPASAGGRGERFERAWGAPRFSGSRASERLCGGGTERGTRGARGTTFGKHAADRASGVFS